MTQINLTQLREHALFINRAGGDTAYIHPDDLLALIDTAEAAIRLHKIVVRVEPPAHTLRPESARELNQAIIRLRETLNRYTTN